MDNPSPRGNHNIQIIFADIRQTYHLPYKSYVAQFLSMLSRFSPYYLAGELRIPAAPSLWSAGGPQT